MCQYNDDNVDILAYLGFESIHSYLNIFVVPCGIEIFKFEDRIQN